MLRPIVRPKQPSDTLHITSHQSIWKCLTLTVTRGERSACCRHVAPVKIPMTTQTSRKGYTIDVDDGGGENAVLVFVFSKYYADVRNCIPA